MHKNYGIVVHTLWLGQPLSPQLRWGCFFATARRLLMSKMMLHIIRQGYVNIGKILWHQNLTFKFFLKRIIKHSEKNWDRWIWEGKKTKKNNGDMLTWGRGLAPERCCFGLFLVQTFLWFWGETPLNLLGEVKQHTDTNHRNFVFSKLNISSSKHLPTAWTQLDPLETILITWAMPSPHS